MVQQSLIAKQLNVSQQTVSRVLNQPHLVRSETRERVLEALRQHGYQPNDLANSLKAKRLKMLGISVPAAGQSYFASLVDGAEQVAEAGGWNVVIECTHNREAAERKAIDVMRRLCFGGALLNPLPGNEEYYRLLQRAGFPFVMIDRYLDDLDAHYVGTDNRLGARMVIEYLVRLGHRRIGIVRGPQVLSSLRDRDASYREVMTQSVGEPDPAWTFDGGFDTEDGRRALRDWLAVPAANRPTALFCDNDKSANGVLQEALTAGLRVPEDLSIVGFAGYEWTAWLAVPLTTVAQQGRQTGVQAAELLFRIMEGSALPPQRMELPPQLTVRASAGPVSR